MKKLIVPTLAALTAITPVKAANEYTAHDLYKGCKQSSGMCYGFIIGSWYSTDMPNTNKLTNPFQCMYNGITADAIAQAYVSYYETVGMKPGYEVFKTDTRADDALAAGIYFSFCSPH